MTQVTGKKPARRGARAAAAATAASALALSAAACGGNLSGGGAGGEFPSGPVNLAVGQEPGGSTDLIGRALADAASEDLGVAMPVVNTPGANGALAATELERQKPDGQNLMVINASLTAITPLAVAEDEAVDITDFEVVTGISQDDYVLVTADSDLDSLKKLTETDKELKFGTTGVGTGSQLAQELLFKEADLDGTAVPFDGGSPTLTAVLGSQVDVAAIQLGEAIEQIKADKLTPLVTFAEKRNQYLPDTPTAVEEGHDVEVSQYRAIVAPKDTPGSAVKRLRTAFKSAFATDAYQKFNKDNLLTAHEVGGDQVVEEWTASLEDYRATTEEFGIDLGEAK